MLRNPVSKRNVISISLVLLALAALGATSLSLMPRAAQAAQRHVHLHLTKNCSAFTGGRGSYCMITDSNLGEIKIGANLYYDQPNATVTALVERGPERKGVLL